MWTSFSVKTVIVFLNFVMSNICTKVELVPSKCTNLYSYNSYKSAKESKFLSLLVKHPLTSWKGYFLSCSTKERQTFQQPVEYMPLLCWVSDQTDSLFWFKNVWLCSMPQTCNFNFESPTWISLSPGGSLFAWGRSFSRQISHSGERECTGCETHFQIYFMQTLVFWKISQ